MALLQCGLFSKVLGMQCSVNIVLPQPDPDAPRRRPVPVLYLLHGYSDDHSIWLRRTSIERYADERGVAVVMPAAGLSFYTDMDQGQRYHAYIADELPALVPALVPVSSKPRDTFVAGLSMGGYGAFKLALTRPDRFAAAASLSGVLDVAERQLLEPGPLRSQMVRVFGNLRRLSGGPHDLMHLLTEAKARGVALPRLFQCCGTADFLYAGNVRFRDHARSLGVPLAYEEGPGEHTWAYWDANIQTVLDWMLER